MGLVVEDDGWRIPDRVWARMEPLLPERPAHPLGCHNPRVADRDAMNAILLVLRTGMQWNALNGMGLCSCSSAYRRFREWVDAGVFLEFWRRGLLTYDDQVGIGGSGWRWTARSARRPSAASSPGPIPPTELKRGETIAPHRGQGHPDRDLPGRRESQRLQVDALHARVDPDRASRADIRAAARALPRPRLRLRRGT